MVETLRATPLRSNTFERRYSVARPRDLASLDDKDLVDSGDASWRHASSTALAVGAQARPDAGSDHARAECRARPARIIAGLMRFTASNAPR